MSASTTLTIAFVPFISIPIHAISFLSNLILLIISLVLILLFSVPDFNPSSSKLCNNSFVCILLFPVISIFQTKLDKLIIAIISNKSSIKNIFLFLYLLNIKGKPFLDLIFTLHLVDLAILFILLKSFIPMFVYAIVDFVLFIFHKNIFLDIQIFINFSTKYPSISILKYPNI